MKKIDYAKIFSEQEEIIQKQAHMIRELTDAIRMLEACEEEEFRKTVKEK